MATLKLIRMRAGFYVTRDAQYRIVRRKLLNKQVTVWTVEAWSANDLRWLVLSQFKTLEDGRSFLANIFIPAMMDS